MSNDKERAGSNRQPWYKMWNVNSEENDLNDLSSTDIVAPENKQAGKRSFLRGFWKRSESTSTDRPSMDDQDTPRPSMEGEHAATMRRTSFGDAVRNAQKDKGVEGDDVWSSWTCA